MMQRKTNPFGLVLLCALFAAFAGCAEQENTAVDTAETNNSAAPVAPAATFDEFKITNITGDLYLAQTRIHSTVFLVTTDGVIMSDPIQADFAEWLKAEIMSRFNTTVKYVLYSHHHPDHAAGGSIFADTATYIGHEQMAVMLGGALPNNAVVQDVNGNGTIERAEARGPYGNANNFASIDYFASFDADGDGSISGTEIHAGTHPIDIAYNDHMTVTLGDSTVEILHSIPTHSEDMSVLYFPEQRAAFGVDFVGVQRFPGDLAGAPVDQYLAALEQMNALDFDILIPGHGTPGTKADLEGFISFLQTSESEVSAAIAAGQTLEEAKESVMLEDFSGWSLYELRRANFVGEMYSILSAN
jgi:glyoxylase-like metal-dependent hydrolase (beta-lactamase superfamily II)